MTSTVGSCERLVCSKGLSGLRHQRAVVAKQQRNLLCHTSLQQVSHGKDTFASSHGLCIDAFADASVVSRPSAQLGCAVCTNRIVRCPVCCQGTATNDAM